MTAAKAQPVEIKAVPRSIRDPAAAPTELGEAPLPPPRLGGQMRPKNWNKWARLLWMMGHSGGEEHVRDARRRAAKAAEVLVARAGEGQDVVLAAHGWFNRMLRPELKKRGWANVHDGGDKYWSFRIYEKR